MHPINPKNYTKKGKAEKNRHSGGKKGGEEKKCSGRTLSFYKIIKKKLLGSSVLKNSARSI